MRHPGDIIKKSFDRRINVKNYSLKKNCLIIAFAGLVLFAVLNAGDISKEISLIGKILMPFWIGIFMAFILNMLMVPIQRFLTKRIFKKNCKPAKPISIVISYLIFVLIIVALLAFVIPELTKSIAAFINNWGTYISQFQKMINDLTVKYNIDAIDLNSIVESLSDNIEAFANKALTYIGATGGGIYEQYCGLSVQYNYGGCNIGEYSCVQGEAYKPDFQNGQGDTAKVLRQA